MFPPFKLVKCSEQEGLVDLDLPLVIDAFSRYRHTFGGLLAQTKKIPKQTQNLFRTKKTIKN